MSLRDLVFEVAELCGHDELATKPVDLASLSVASIHPSAESYFADCVLCRHIDRPFYQLLSASDITARNTEYTPSCHIVPFGFVTFANEPNGDAIVVDANDGRIHLVSHEIYADDGIMDFDVDDPIPISRESILKYSHNIFPSISAFFKSWRDQLIDLHNEQNSFLEAAVHDPNATDEFGNTLIIHFIRDGDLNMVKSEVKRGADLEHLNREGRTALGEAVTFGHPKIVSYLIKSGAKVNAVNDRGKTPLMIAAHYSQLPCMKILIKAGADRSATDVDGETAVEQLCVIHGTPAMKKLLTPRTGT